MILSKAYKEIMDKVQVDAAMHERILTNVQKQPPKHRFSLPKIMRITSMAACLLLCIGFAGLYPWQNHAPAVLPPSLPHIEQAAPEPEPLPQTQPTPKHSKHAPSTETPSPLPQQAQQLQAEPAAQQTVPAAVATTENALQLMGAAAPQVHSFETDDELARYVGFDVRDLNNIPFWVKEAKYQVFDKDLAQITYTNGKRSLVYRKSPGDEDNSGDYTHYPFIWETTQNRRNISLKGNGTLFHLAVWQKYGYSYSLRSSKGMSSKDFLKIILSNEE